MNNFHYGSLLKGYHGIIAFGIPLHIMPLMLDADKKALVYNCYDHQCAYSRTDGRTLAYFWLDRGEGGGKILRFH